MKRLLLRLGTTCNNGCAHCTVADLRGKEEDRSTLAIFESLVRGREEGATEVVFLRGEATIRPDFLRIVRRARDLGYGQVQIQSNGRMFATPGFARDALNAGMTRAEVSIYGVDADTHDAIAQVPGAFEQTVRGMRKLLFEGALCHVNIPVLRENLHQLEELVSFLAEEGVERLQFAMTRPTAGQTVGVPGLDEAMSSILAALHEAEEKGVEATTEGVPLCVLGSFSRGAGDRFPPPFPMIIDDLHRRVDDLTALRAHYRPFPEECAPCGSLSVCPGTWKGLWKKNGDLKPIPMAAGGYES